MNNQTPDTNVSNDASVNESFTMENLDDDFASPASNEPAANNTTAPVVDDADNSTANVNTDSNHEVIEGVSIPDPNDQSNSDSTNSDANSDNEDDNLEEYSKPALFTKALHESGLPIFGDEIDEIPKDLDIPSFVNKVNTYSDTRAQQVVQLELQKLGKDAEYIYLKKQGIPMEALDPAIEAERFAQFNVEDPTVTEDQLEEVVRAMYSKQIADQTTIDGLIMLDKQNKLLKDKAINSVAFHDELITNVKNQAIYNHEQAQIANKNRALAAQQEFADNLRSIDNIDGIDINDQDRARIFDNMHNKDQAVQYQDPTTGEYKVEYLTKYEVMVNRLVNDPEQLIKLNYLLLNNFNLDVVTNSVGKKINKNLLDAIEGKKAKGGNNSNSNSNITVNTNTVNNGSSNKVLGSFEFN